MIKYTPKLPSEGVNTSKDRKVIRRLVKCCFFALVIIGIINFCLAGIGEYVAVKYEKEINAAVGDSICDKETSNTPESRDIQTKVDKLLKAYNKPLKMHVCVTDKVMREKNAFATFGPTLVVTKKMYEEVKNGNDISLVLAHEIGHTVHGDCVRSVGRSFGTIGIALALSLMQPTDSDVAKIVMEILSTNSLKYSREAEYAADEFGAELCKKALDNPLPAFHFLEKALLENDPGALEIIATHPDSKKRVERMKKIIVGE